MTVRRGWRYAAVAIVSLLTLTLATAGACDPPKDPGTNSGPYKTLTVGNNGRCKKDDKNPDRPKLVAEAKAIGRALSAKKFKDKHWRSLEKLWDHESGWYPRACNLDSGACAVPQALPCSKLKDKTTRGQIEWGLSYIKENYKNPSNAWDFWQCTSNCKKHPGAKKRFKTGAKGDPKTNWY